MKQTILNVKKKSILIMSLFVALAIVLISCGEDDPATPVVPDTEPVAIFAVASTNDLTVTFSNNSTNATKYTWDFDDNGATSTETAPSHTFSEEGTYTVSLTAEDDDGDTDVETLDVTVSETGVASVEAGFISAVDAADWQTYTFTSTTTFNNIDGTGATYAWDFDDNGATSDLESPSHTFSGAGSYEVSLTVTASDGTTTDTETQTLTLEAPTEFFQGIPLGTDGYYINKIIASPDGDDQTKEYFEIVGPADQVIPSDLYLISIEGDGDGDRFGPRGDGTAGSTGSVQEAILLGDGSRTFGSNGIVVIHSSYIQDSGGSTAGDGTYPSVYDGLINSDATIIEIVVTGTDVTSSSSSTFTSASPDIGYDGNFIDQTATYMLISADANPDGLRIDGTGMGDADGNFEATGDHTSWTLHDSITMMDEDDNDGNDDNHNGEFGYGQIIFANIPVTVSNHYAEGATVIELETTSNIIYGFRQGASTGWETTDWVGAGNGSGSAPNWEFSGTASKVSSQGFLGWDQMNQYYGELNPIDDNGTLVDP